MGMKKTYPPHRAVGLHKLIYVKHFDCLAHGKHSIINAVNYLMKSIQAEGTAYAKGLRPEQVHCIGGMARSV